ncbi:PfkB family carbohydrate kinase [Microcella alkalica]|uniref:Sugar/nucleoside kinase (Ribokinase family) n=1 Tax=Microcella alkalica TaxID=355930 RepID=A0A839EH81_9MICO|nr:PfkB family carbohydrate kinase [Microcella alkalica]MBA8848918.1 sugar/nucleoside kinase (ribokinase family) [Microcella alkalica]
MTARLVSVGNALIDLALDVPHLPARGGDVRGRSRGLHAGGAVNVLLAARRQGLPAAYAGAHGTGPLGDRVRELLAAAGVEVLLAPHPSLDTGVDVAFTEPDGERSFATAFGAEAELDAGALASVAIADDDVVHVSGYGLLDSTNGAVLSQWIDGLPERATVLLDPGPLAVAERPAALEVALARADWVSASLEEARAITGEQEPAAAARALATRDRGAVVRRGADGCLVAVCGSVEHVAGFVVEQIDATGAGDAHLGAFAAALARGEAPGRAARVANAAAAIAVTRPGPGTAPTLAEALELAGC